MIRRFLACLVFLSAAQPAFAGPLQDGIARAAQASVQARGRRQVNGNAMLVSGGVMIGTGATLANTSMHDDTIICGADAVWSCGYGSGPKKGALPWGLRRAGVGVALTILGANISIQRAGLKVSKSVTF